MMKLLDISPNSDKNRFRAHRINLLNGIIRNVLSENRSCSVIDIGGTFGFWNAWQDQIDWRRVEITCVNRNMQHAASEENKTPVRMIEGNACDMDEIGDGTYDIAFSNSVIEHVGAWPEMSNMACEVRRVASRYLVQTPNFWFPIEPHARSPFLHWLPEHLAYRIIMRRRCGFWPKQTSVSGAVSTVQSARLLDDLQMRSLFPDAQILREKFLGLTKSLIAIKSN